ncbi:MAG: hypothetical protein SPLM_10450 [Spiroplasma phoeniceum]
MKITKDERVQYKLTLCQSDTSSSVRDDVRFPHWTAGPMFPIGVG